jgi:hypothetical protein
VPLPSLPAGQPPQVLERWPLLCLRPHS